MPDKEYERKHKESNPVVAICYDFDKTLSPDDMQAQGYIQSVGYDVPDFWKKSNSLASDNEIPELSNGLNAFGNTEKAKELSWNTTSFLLA